MGVTYKLTDDIVHFILEEKQKDPQLSCRALVERIAKNLQREVSKSSVSEVLRHANITSPRGRKSKEKFEIPQDKKDQLRANLPKIALERQQQVPQAPAPPSIPQKLPDLVPQAEAISCQETLLKAAYFDLFPRRNPAAADIEVFKQLPLKELEFEWSYRNQLVGGFKIAREEKCLYLDARWQRMGASAFIEPACLCPVERALLEAADFLEDRSKPALIGWIQDFDVLREFSSLMEGRKIASAGSQMEVLGPTGETMATLPAFFSARRDFISAVDVKAIKIEYVRMDEPSSPFFCYGCFQPFVFSKVNLSAHGWTGRALWVKKAETQESFLLVSNVLPSRMDDVSLVRFYMHRFAQHVSSATGYGGCADLCGLATGQEALRCYVSRQFLGRQIGGGQWDELDSIKGSVSSNEDLWQASFAASQGLRDFLPPLLQRINSLYLKDEKNHQIYLLSH